MILATFRAKCPACGDTIHQRDEIEKTEIGWTHLACADVEFTEDGERPICVVEGCATGVARKGTRWLQMCSAHRSRKWKYGDPLAGPPIHRRTRPTSDVCSIQGCGNPHDSHGLCAKHASRRRRHGADLVLVEQHGLSGNPLYGIWKAMHDRCSNTKHPAFHRYGGRGITVCDRWCGTEGLLRFVEDMGERPSDPKGWQSSRPYWSLDRIDPNGNYGPSNCRWADPKTQAANKGDCEDCDCRVHAALRDGAR